MPTTRCIAPASTSASCSRRAARAGRAGQQRDAEARRLQQPRDVDEVLLGQDLGRRHERHLQAVLHRDERRQQRDDRLARADVALQQPVHRLRPLQVVDDLLQRLPLPGGQPERQHAPRRLADAIVDANRRRLPLRRGRLPPRQHAHLKQKRLLEDQPRCAGVANRFSSSIGASAGGKCAARSAACRAGSCRRSAQLLGQRDRAGRPAAAAARRARAGAASSA